MSFLTLAAKAATSGGSGAAAALCGGKSPYNNPCLPILRWGDYIGTLNYRGGQSIGTGWFQVNVDPLRRIPSQVASALLGAGNGLYQSAADFLTKAENWSWGVDGQASSTTVKFGQMANTVAAGIYNGITTGGGLLIGLIITVAIIMLLGRAIRLSGSGGAGVAKRFVALACGVGLFLTMGAQAADNPNASTPPAMTPWWVANTTGELVNKMGGNMLKGLVKGTDSQLATYDYEGKSALSCRGYLKTLSDKAADGKGDNQVDPNILSLDHQWENTALPMWDREFFSDPENADYTFCRVLETKASVPPAAQIAITQTAAGKGDASKSPFQPITKGGYTEKAMMFNEPSVISQSAVNAAKEGKDNNHVQVSEDDGTKLDQYLVAWETCGLNPKKAPGKDQIHVREGWQFVNRIEGEDRGGGNDGNAGGDQTPGRHNTGLQGDLESQCYAALYGQMPNGTNAGTDSTINPKSGAVWGTGDEGQPGNGNFARIVEKFDLPASGSAGGANWQTIAKENNTGSEAQREQAITTVKAQHGADGMSNINAAFMFMLAGFVNFAIYGIVLTLSKLLSLATAMLMAVFLWVLLLAWAVSPDTYGRKMGSMFVKLVGMTGANILLSIFFSLVSVISTAMLDATGILADNNLTLLAVCGGVFPVVASILIAKLLEAVGLGHLTPKSLAKFMGGAALMGGVATIGRGVAQRVRRGSIGMGRGRHAMPDGSDAHGAMVGKGGDMVPAHKSAAASAAAAAVKSKEAPKAALAKIGRFGAMKPKGEAKAAIGALAAGKAAVAGKTRLGQHMASFGAKHAAKMDAKRQWVKAGDVRAASIRGTRFSALRDANRKAMLGKNPNLMDHRVRLAMAATARAAGQRVSASAWQRKERVKAVARRSGQWVKNNGGRLALGAVGAAAGAVALGVNPIAGIAAGAQAVGHAAGAVGAAAHAAGAVAAADFKANTVMTAAGGAAAGVAAHAQMDRLASSWNAERESAAADIASGDDSMSSFRELQSAGDFTGGAQPEPQPAPDAGQAPQPEPQPGAGASTGAGPRPMPRPTAGGRPAPQPNAGARPMPSPHPDPTPGPKPTPGQSAGRHVA